MRVRPVSIKRRLASGVTIIFKFHWHSALSLHHDLVLILYSSVHPFTSLTTLLGQNKCTCRWVFRAPVMAVAAVEEPAKGVVKVCVALANRWVVTIELPHPEAVHRARGAAGDAYSILSDEAREAVDMEPMHPELFEADAVDFYIPGTLPCACTTSMPPCFYWLSSASVWHA